MSKVLKKNKIKYQWQLFDTTVKHKTDCETTDFLITLCIQRGDLQSHVPAFHRPGWKTNLDEAELISCAAMITNTKQRARTLLQH